ncbi:MAG: TIGR03757 family integrating conjugative element protein [Candidatus Accumulibacter sp.]|jgi:integrating conjugative element protein (TIGR03757 family)|nr:TIGR03757 family integrating conjugative element protein [Accumulibacter sp.]
MPTLSFRFLCVLFFAVFSLPAAADVLVVTDKGHPVKAAGGARVIELDLPARIEAELSSGLPSDPARAANLARQRMGDRALPGRLLAAYQGIAEARNLKIAKIPAVVVDGRYVVYGDPNVARAIARIDAYRSARP